MKVYIIDENTIVNELSFNEDKNMLNRVTSPRSINNRAGFGAQKYGGGQNYRTSDNYFSIKEKIIALIKKIIGLAISKFGPESKLSANQTFIKTKVNEVNSKKDQINNLLKSNPIQINAISMHRPTVDLQSSFNEILNGFNIILNNPKSFDDEKDYSIHDGFIGTPGAAHRALNSVISLMCSNITLDKSKPEGDKDRWKGGTKYTLIHKDNESDLKHHKNDFIFNLYEDKDNINNYAVSIQTSTINFNNTNEIVKFMNNRLLAIGTIVNQINIGNKQLEGLKNKINNMELKSKQIEAKAKWITEEYSYLLKGLTIVCNKFVSDVVNLSNMINSKLPKNESSIFYNLEMI